MESKGDPDPTLRHEWWDVREKTASNLEGAGEAVPTGDS